MNQNYPFSSTLFSVGIFHLLLISSSFSTPTNQFITWIKSNCVQLIWIQTVFSRSISGSCLIIRHTTGVTKVFAVSLFVAKTAIFWLILQKEIRPHDIPPWCICCIDYISLPSFWPGYKHEEGRCPAAAVSFSSPSCCSPCSPSCKLLLAAAPLTNLISECKISILGHWQDEALSNLIQLDDFWAQGWTRALPTSVIPWVCAVFLLSWKMVERK